MTRGSWLENPALADILEAASGAAVGRHASIREAPFV